MHREQVESLYSPPEIKDQMTKADLVAVIARKTGIEREVVLATIESFMEEVRNNLSMARPCICAVSAVLW